MNMNKTACSINENILLWLQCWTISYLLQGGYIFVVVGLSVSNFAKNFRTNLHKTFREGWQWANEQITKFWQRFGSPSGYRDCFSDLSLLGDTESGIIQLRCAMLQWCACTSRHHHSNYDVITSLALGRSMHCPSASRFIIWLYWLLESWVFL